MSLVLDVSVAVKWFLADEGHAAATDILEYVSREGAHVPALFRWEIQSVMLSAERASRIDPDDVDVALEALRDLPITVERAGERVFAGSEVQLARHYGLTPYDASYLSLAASRKLPLATFDRALARSAADLGIKVLPA